MTQVLTNLNDFIVTTPDLPRSSITWELVADGDHGLVGVSRRPDASHPDGVRWVMSVLGERSGVDTLHLVATDTLGRSETAITTIRYFGESEQLELRAIPNIVFIAGTFFDGLRLNDFILDHETHPDSLIRWTQVEIGSSNGGIIIEVNDDSTVRALSFDIAETEIVFIAHNDSLGITGRDTVLVIAQDPALAARELLTMPPMVIQAGSVNSSIVLNDFLPEDLGAGITNWSVSGASITNPVIDPVAPHQLLLSSIGTSVGTDTLSFRVNLGGGFIATGQLLVTVIEPIDESTLSLRIVPNPLSANFLDFFVMARTELTSSPTVVITFEGDTTVAVRQIEAELGTRGVLIWAGSFRVRVGGTGTVLFRTQAITALGTSVSAQASITLATAGSGKPLALRHGAVTVLIPPDAVADGQLVFLQSVLLQSGQIGEQVRPAARIVTGVAAGVATGVATGVLARDELTLQHEIRLWPAGLHLERPARLVLSGDLVEGSGFYRSVGGVWEWLSSTDVAEVERFGRYGILIDRTAPALEIDQTTHHPGIQAGDSLHLVALDGGSGIAADGVFAVVDGQRIAATPGADTGNWVATLSVVDPTRAGLHSVLFVARDRAGNETRKSVDLTLSARLPRQLQLGANFPNPFNPETTIPLQIASGVTAGVRLRVYNTAGQVVRELLDNTIEAMEPGWHEVRWDGRDDAGRQLSSGVYFYRLESAGQLLTRSMTMLK